GVGARLANAVGVPRLRGDHGGDLIGEFRAWGRPHVFLGLVLTVRGFGGGFYVVTHAGALLTGLRGINPRGTPPVPTALSVGLVVGNTYGGKLADKRLMHTLAGSLALLSVVLAVFSITAHDKVAAVITVTVLGAAAFATVPALQMRVLEKASDAPNLASAFNIAAFNLGNAAGAWLGGVTIDHGPGLAATPLVAAAVTAGGLLIALYSWKLDRQPCALATA